MYVVTRGIPVEEIASSAKVIGLNSALKMASCIWIIAKEDAEERPNSNISKFLEAEILEAKTIVKVAIQKRIDWTFRANFL